MTHIRFSRKMEKGTWKFSNLHVMTQCPECGTGSMVKDMSIDHEGKVKDFLCRACQFAGIIILDDFFSFN